MYLVVSNYLFSNARAALLHIKFIKIDKQINYLLLRQNLELFHGYFTRNTPKQWLHYLITRSHAISRKCHGQDLFIPK